MASRGEVVSCGVREKHKDVRRGICKRGGLGRMVWIGTNGPGRCSFLLVWGRGDISMGTMYRLCWDAMAMGRSDVVRGFL